MVLKLCCLVDVKVMLICINNSIDTIVERIMKTESNNSDNKENFYPKDNARKSSIPQSYFIFFKW